jgi:hypothetical protein
MRSEQFGRLDAKALAEATISADTACWSALGSPFSIASRRAVPENSRGRGHTAEVLAEITAADGLLRDQETDLELGKKAAAEQVTSAEYRAEELADHSIYSAFGAAVFSE